MAWTAEITKTEAERMLRKRENEFGKDLRRDREAIQATRIETGCNKTHGADGNRINDVCLNRLENHGKCLRKINAAWQRIRDGTYGICSGKCQKLIPEEELRITPERTLCVPCKNSENKRPSRPLSNVGVGLGRSYEPSR